ncbi:MAG: alpha/beta hydrolase [Kiritimatiellia bacterium]
MKHEFKSYYLDAPLVKGRALDVFVPEQITRDVSIFIVHGGGWRGGNRQSFHPIMEAFNNEGIITASTDYRLGAKDAFEQLSDIRASCDRFVSILKEMGRPLKIAVYGESAGSHLASLLVCAAPGACGENNSFANKWVAPSFGLLHATPATFEPWEDIYPQVWSAMQDIAGASYKKDPGRYRRLSLCRYIGKNNPPLFFIEAEYECMFYSDMNRKLLAKHRRLGIPSQMKIYPRMEHGFFYALARKQQKACFRDIIDFIDGRKVKAGEA